MIVYVETNFVLELAYMQEEHERCDEVLALAEQQKIELLIPAFSVSEPYESWVRRAKRRAELHSTLDRELTELARSKPYQQSSVELQELTKMLAQSGQEEKQRLDVIVRKLLQILTVIPSTSAVLQSALLLQNTRNLSPQDSIVYASVLSHLSAVSMDAPKCFITKNSKDFTNPDIESDLTDHNCKLLTKFKNGLGYIKSNLPS